MSIGSHGQEGFSPDGNGLDEGSEALWNHTPALGHNRTNEKKPVGVVPSGVQKTIILVRHGTSEGQKWRDIGMQSRSDPRLLDCYLTRKGVNEACNCGRQLVKDGVIPELVVVSPLTRAIQTACSMFMEPAARMVVHPAAAELGGGIPENRARPWKQLERDDALSCHGTFWELDTGLLPPGWPRGCENNDKEGAGELLRWLAVQPEETVVVVCHHNTILAMLGRHVLQKVANCVPITRILVEEAGHAILLDPESLSAAKPAQEAKPKKKKKK